MWNFCLWFLAVCLHFSCSQTILQTALDIQNREFNHRVDDLLLISKRNANKLKDMATIYRTILDQNLVIRKKLSFHASAVTSILKKLQIAYDALKDKELVGKCIGVPESDETFKCRSLGFNRTAFPNWVGYSSMNEKETFSYLNFLFNIYAATNCYKHSDLFACSVSLPKCSETPVTPNHIIPPCRSLCQAFKENCFVFMEIFALPWPKELNCSSVPDSNDTTVCTGFNEANETPQIRDCDEDEVQCDTDRCIAKSYICDGFQDCRDYSDEKFCSQCSQGQQRCYPSSALCIDQRRVCDGSTDCYLASDENMCIKLEYGDHGRLLVYNAAGRFDKWEEVCLKGWSTSHSKIACSQLGYIGYNGFEETTESFRQKSLVISTSVDTDNHLIQSYLVKSKGTTCPNGKVIGLVCGKPVCGTRPAYYPSPLRVVNGDEVKPGTWPFVVELLGGRRRVHFCGAVIIGQRWVMTAAHCIGPKRKSDGIYLNIGGIRRFAYSKYRQTKRAKVFYVHPDYSSMTVENDIALIETSSPIQFNDYVRPVCLPGSDDETPVGTRCYVTGWGKTEADFLPTLMEVSLNIVEWRKCKKDIDNAPMTGPFELKSNNICAGGGFSHDACAGDSGGPLLCPSDPSGDTWKATGIVSWGLDCALQNVPGVYTQVSKNASWIRNVTRNEVMVP